jgi:hypothetical protein
MAKESLEVKYYPKESAKSTKKPEEYDWNWDKYDEPYEQIIALLRQMDTYQKTKLLRFNLYARLYLNKYTNNNWNKNYFNNVENYTKQKVSWNVVASSVDTLTNKIGKQKPRPYFLTKEGDQKAQDKAKKLTQYIDGVFRDANTYEQGALVFKDAAIFCKGMLYIYMTPKGVVTRRININNVYVDEVDGSTNNPTQIHFKDLVDRSALKDMYPDKVGIIDECPKFTANGSYENVSDCIVVIYSFKLKSGEKAKDGCFTVSIDTGTLVKKKWDQDYIPVVFYDWKRPLEGFYGQSAAEELVGTQLEINKLLNRIQQAIHLIAVPRIFLNTVSKIPDVYFSNKLGGIIPYSGGVPPTFQTAQSMNPEVYRFLESLWNRGFEQVGLSQLSATSQKPAGLDSGVALRTHHDIETERFAEHVQRYESFFLDVSKIVIYETEKAYKNGQNIPVKAGKKFLETLKWSDVRLDSEKYILDNYPTSIIPSTPEGALATVSNLIQAGLLDKETGKRLLDFPDLQAELTLDFASDELIKQSLELIIDKKQYIEPDEALNPLRSLMYGHKEYLKQLKHDADDEILELLLDWIDDSKANLSKQAQSAQMQSQQVNQPPLAQPEPLPTNELLPQVAA